MSRRDLLWSWLADDVESALWWEDSADDFAAAAVQLSDPSFARAASDASCAGAQAWLRALVTLLEVLR